MNRTRVLEKDLAFTIRRLYERELVSGIGGNASVLLPNGKEFLITPSGYFKGGVAEGDLVRVGLDGRVKSRGSPSSELATHIAVYRGRRDVRAVVHAHPPIAVALITVGIAIPPMTPEHAALVTKPRIVDFALPGQEGAKRVREALKESDLIGIRNHGFFSLAGDLHTAASRLEVIEESAKIHLIARQFGKLSGLEEEEVRKIGESYGLIHGNSRRARSL